MDFLFVVCFLGLFGSLLAHSTEGGSDKLKVFALSSSQTDGLQRFLRSAKSLNYNVRTIGAGAGTSMRKANIIKTELKAVCSSAQAQSDGMLYMFVDAQDVVLAGSPIEIVSSFKKLDADIVFSADKHVWPNESLADTYPQPLGDDYPYLCSGAFIGSSKTVCELFSYDVDEVEDDQLFFTQLYLDKEMRSKYNIKLDGRAEIFQSMHGASEDVSIKYVGTHSIVLNNRFLTTPKVIIANGARVELNRLGDYVPDNWSAQEGCEVCKEDRISLDEIHPNEWPLVVLAIFIESPTPFVPSMLRRLVRLNYPMNRIVLAVHNNVPFHAPNVTEFLASSIVAEYNSIEILIGERLSVEGDMRNQVLDICNRVNCEFIFEVDALAHFNNPDTLKRLIEQNRPVISPLLRRPSEVWSNFWGSVTATGYYSRSSDYMDIVNGVKRGIWNVPCISSAILIRADRIDDVRNAWFSSGTETAAAFCSFMREQGHFMYVDNQNLYGHLVNPSNYNISHYRPELWEMSTNRLDWEELYIDPAYWKIGANKDDGTAVTAQTYETKCVDVYLYPLVTETFCRHLIDEMEHYGKWSGGSHNDPRLSSGYEAIPTVDIHMRQIDFHQEWLQFLKTYISPLAKYSFFGYEPQSRATMAFVVRYHPDEQTHLQGHFDTATWTSVIPLTRPGIDFEGGGTRFVRRNCSITNAPRGHTVIFPGRLTHWHEGLPVTKGVRYISVTFADP